MSRILSTFTALSLLVALAACGKSRDAARAELAQMNIAYTDKAFVESAREGNATAVALFIDAGINPDTKKTVRASRRWKRRYLPIKSTLSESCSTKARM